MMLDGFLEGPDAWVPPFLGRSVGTSQGGYQVEVLGTHDKGGKNCCGQWLFTPGEAVFTPNRVISIFGVKMQAP